VKILLGREDVNPNKQDNKGQTPLMAAASWGGHEGVEMPLERQEATSDKPGHHGQTALVFACIKDHKRVIDPPEPPEAANAKQQWNG